MSADQCVNSGVDTCGNESSINGDEEQVRFCFGPLERGDARRVQRLEAHNLMENGGGEKRERERACVCVRVRVREREQMCAVRYACIVCHKTTTFTHAYVADE